jgi:hypothetical protein
MPTRHYFKKAIAPVKPPKVRRPNHKGKLVMVEIKPNLWRTMSSREYAMQLGRSKGGLTAAARGTAFRWTSEQATKAIKKCWAKRWGKGSRIGVRLGRPAKLRPAIDRIALRAQYSICAKNGIFFDVGSQKWWRGYWEGEPPRVLSERQALTILGHLAGLHKPVPSGRVIQVPGRRIASSKDTKEEK